MDPNERNAAGKDMKPTVTLLDEKGKELLIPNSKVPAHYLLPAGALITLSDGEKIGVR